MFMKATEVSRYTFMFALIIWFHIISSELYKSYITCLKEKEYDHFTVNVPKAMNFIMGE